jgi:hypothetical protein
MQRAGTWAAVVPKAGRRRALPTQAQSPQSPLVAKPGLGRNVTAPSHPIRAPVHPQGWGVGSLDQDADELLALSRHLRAELGSRGFVLMGHSTGCQVGRGSAQGGRTAETACRVPPWGRPRVKPWPHGHPCVHVRRGMTIPQPPPVPPCPRCPSCLLHSYQDAVRFCQRHGDAEGAALLEGVILQGPVGQPSGRASIGGRLCLARCLAAERRPCSTCTQMLAPHLASSHARLLLQPRTFAPGRSLTASGSQTSTPAS